MVIPDVIEAILVRCVVKDLLRSKSVCKSWYSLISSPSFAKTQVKFINNKEEDNTRKIAMIGSYFDVDDCFMRVPPEWRSYDKWSMQGSCNGLVCLHSRGGPRICVTNPVTREFRELEQPPKRIPRDMQCLGFGYDSSSDDYKVVLAICQQGKALVHILSLKSNVWKLFGQVNYWFNDSTLAVPGILFNGALHWFWFNPNDATRKNILLVSFDLAKEEFREIPQPDDTRYVWNSGHKLGIIEGRLCIFPSHKERAFPSCGIWVMKSYNSWELFLNAHDMKKDHAIHYMLKDTSEDRITPPTTYFCDENTQLSRSKEHIPSPMFVQTLVSPYVYNNNNDGPSHAKNNKGTVNAGSVQEKRD